MKNKVSFKEAVIVLLAMLIIMGLGVIKFGLSPQVPVLLVLVVVTFWAVSYTHLTLPTICSV